MVHSFKDSRLDFANSGGIVPGENIEYTRNGGCFITIKKGCLLFAGVIVAAFIVALSVHHITKSGLEATPPFRISDALVELETRFPAAQTNYEPNFIQPKSYHLFIRAVDMVREEWHGIMWIQCYAERPNLRKIKFAVENLNVQRDQIGVVILSSSSDASTASTTSTATQTDDQDALNCGSRFKFEAGILRKRACSSDTISDRISMSPHRKRRQLIQQQQQEEQQQHKHTQHSNKNEDMTDLNWIDDAINSFPFEQTTIVPFSLTDDSSIAGEVSRNKSEDDLVTMQSSSSSSSSSSSTPLPPSSVRSTNTISYNNDYFDMTELGDQIELGDITQTNKLLTVHMNFRTHVDYLIRIPFSGNVTDLTAGGLVFAQHQDIENGEISSTVFTQTGRANTPKMFPFIARTNRQAIFNLHIAREIDRTVITNLKYEKSWPNVTDSATGVASLVIDGFSSPHEIHPWNVAFAITNMAGVEYPVAQSATIGQQRPSSVTVTYFMTGRYRQQIDTQDEQHKLDDAVKRVERIMDERPVANDIKILFMPNYFGEDVIMPGFIVTKERDQSDFGITLEILTHFLTAKCNFSSVDDEKRWLIGALPLYLMNSGDASRDKRFLWKSKAMRQETLLRTSAVHLFSNSQSDEILKMKGLAILSMLNFTMMTPKNNSPSSFVSLLLKQKSDEKLFNFDEILHSWSSHNYYPIINVDRLNGTMEISQAPFNSFASNLSETLRWIVPVFYVAEDQKDFEAGTKNWLLNNNRMIVQNNATTVGDPWPWTIFNPMGIGYYRVNYDEETWNNLAELLGNRDNNLPDITKSVLIDDAFGLALNGHVPLSVPFKLVAIIKDFERSTLVWTVLFENVNFIWKNVKQIDYTFYNTFIAELLASFGKIIESLSVDDTRENLQQLHEFWACKFWRTDCVLKQMHQFEVTIQKANPFDGTLRYEELAQIICTGIKYGTFHHWHLAMAHIDRTDPNQIRSIVQGLSCARDRGQISILVGYVVRTAKALHDLGTMGDILLAFGQNEIITDYFLEYLFDNFERVLPVISFKQLGIFFGQIAIEKHFQTLQKIIQEHQHQITADDVDILKDVLYRIRLQLKLNEWIVEQDLSALM